MKANSYLLRRLLVAAVLLAAIAGGGYAFGKSRAPTEQDALSARLQQVHQAFVGEVGKARERGVKRGLAAGGAAGKREGSRYGKSLGRTYGQADALARTRPKHRSGGGESELGASGLDGSGGVLVVGDSLEVLTTPYLKQYLPGIQVTAKAATGASSLGIYDFFTEEYDPSQSVIVFDAGTNDDPGSPEILAGRLSAVAAAIGNRCMVVPTIHQPTVDGVTPAAKNAVIRDFASSRPGTQVPDWAGFVDSHPELMQADNLHPLPAGADERAQLIALGVLDCLQL